MKNPGDSFPILNNGSHHFAFTDLPEESGDQLCKVILSFEIGQTDRATTESGEFFKLHRVRFTQSVIGYESCLTA